MNNNNNSRQSLWVKTSPAFKGGHTKMAQHEKALIKVEFQNTSYLRIGIYSIVKNQWFQSDSNRNVVKVC